MSATIKTFYAEAVLFDMDGTLTNSIDAVEAAWGKVAEDIGQDRAHVIAATHGKRAIDNLSEFKPHIKPHQMDNEVTAFEESILYYADAYNLHGPGSRRNSTVATPVSGSQTPALSTSEGSSAPSSRAPSISQPLTTSSRRPSFATRLHSILNMTAVPEGEVQIQSPTTIGEYHSQFEETMEDVDDFPVVGKESTEETADEMLMRHTFEAWELEAQSVDRSVRILPGVKRIISSIPNGRYAVATSGAKLYAHGCMTRVGITPPPVTITADDKRLKAGKPAPDPFLLAAKCLGYPATQCVVFEDSPSGIRAGVASGATVIAVCTSHERKQIENCGAHYIVDDMDDIICTYIEGKGMRFQLKIKA